jgi:hypothetical protein
MQTLQEKLNTLNTRTGYEWDNFIAKYGANYESLTEEAKQKAIELGIMQSLRFRNRINELGFSI